MPFWPRSRTIHQLRELLPDTPEFDPTTHQRLGGSGTPESRKGDQGRNTLLAEHSCTVTRRNA